MSIPDKAYVAVLANFKTAWTPHASWKRPRRDLLLEVLKARAIVATVDGSNIDLDLVASSDTVLRELAAQNEELRDQCRELRQALRPEEKSWWWNLDEVPDSPSKRASIAAVIGLVAFGMSVAFANDILGKLTTEGFSLLAVIALLMQIVLALAAGSTFTSLGARLGRNWMREKGRPAADLPFVSMRLAITLLFLSMIFRYGFPTLEALWLRSRAFSTQDVAIRIDLLERANKVFPRDAQAHYELAKSYELEPDLKKAEENYRLSIHWNPDYWPAYLDFAHLLLSEDKPAVNEALDVLYQLHEKDLALPDKARYRISYKENLAWAYHLLGHEELALDTIENEIPPRVEESDSNPPVEAMTVCAMIYESLADKLQAAGKIGEAETYIGMANVNYNRAMNLFLKHPSTVSSVLEARFMYRGTKLLTLEHK